MTYIENMAETAPISAGVATGPGISDADRRALATINNILSPNADPGASGGGLGGAGGGGRGEGGGGGSPPEGSQPPEGFRRFRDEEIWSPEYRSERWRVVQELIWVGVRSYEEKYGNPGNRDYVSKLYKYWKYLEALDNKKSYSSKPFDAEELEVVQIPPETQPQLPSDDLTNVPSFRMVSATYDNPESTPAEKDAAKEGLSRYFNEAKKINGLLNGIDESLKELYVEIMQGMEVVEQEGEGRQRRRLTKAQIMDRVIKDRQTMSKLGERAFSELQRSDSVEVNLAKIAKFDGVWDLYADLAVDRFALLLNGGGLIGNPHIPGEFNFDIGRVGPEGVAEYKRLAQEKEIYWRPTWANYFEVTARTPEQFRIAAETFIRWMRTGLGKSPDELFQKINGFKEALTSAGQRGDSEIQEYTVELKLELEAVMGIIGANFANEQYHADYYKQFWGFTAKDQGPDRMVQLSKTARGIMAAVLYKFDKDPRFELLFSPHGSRGELMGRERNAIEMGVLQKQILAILTAEVMGIAMKRYHPDDPEKRLSNKMYERNLREISKFKSDEAFENLYEGIDLEEQENLYNQLKLRLRVLSLRAALADDANPRPLSDEDNRLYAAFEGKEDHELELKPSEKLSLERLELARKIQHALQAGKDPSELEGEEKTMFEEARNAVTLAYEVYGAMGEKARKGGTVFLVDRKDAEGRFFWDYIPFEQAKQLVRFAVNWTKAEYGGELDAEALAKIRKEDPKRPGRQAVSAEEMFYREGQAKRMAIWALKAHGYNAKLWDFTLLRNGKPVDINTIGYTQYGINRKKDSTKETVDRYRYAVPENSRILGYNTKGEEVILAFDDNGKPVTLEFDSNGRPTGSLVPLEFDKGGQAVIYNKPVTVKKKQNGRWIDIAVTDRKRITFDNLNDKTRATEMLLKTPLGEINPQTHKLNVTSVDKVPVGFERAIKHIFSRTTFHAYPGYQEEWTGLVLSKEAFAAAREIKAGRLRWEDAPPHAVQLLMLDPTLERVGHFDLESLECLVNLAAGEDNYQSEWMIGDELYENFFPPDASRLKNRTAYVLQDHGGLTKQWYHHRGEAALWPDAKVRRLRTFIPYIPLHFNSMASMWGAPSGALDVFRMMGYEKYRLVGQFAMDKYVNQIGAAKDSYDALFDWYDEQAKKMQEGLGRKLNNEADIMRKFHRQLASGILGHSKKILSVAEDEDEDFLKTFRGTLGRVEVVMNRNTVLESLFRGERAPLWLEGIEIYKRRPDGTYEKDEDGNKIFNEKIDWNRDSGSGRHSNERFVWRYFRLLRSDQAREGQELYAGEAKYYELGDYYTISSMRLAKEKNDPSLLETRFEYFDGKANN